MLRVEYLGGGGGGNPQTAVVSSVHVDQSGERWK